MVYYVLRIEDVTRGTIIKVGETELNVYASCYVTEHFPGVYDAGEMDIDESEIKNLTLSAWLYLEQELAQLAIKRAKETPKHLWNVKIDDDAEPEF